MRPPECAICDTEFDPFEGGDTVYFRETESDKKQNQRMERQGLTGHPPNCDWFCNAHLKQAQDLQHLHLAEALVQMRR
ncbi:MAG: hypothetical protein ACXAE3_12720 [Candidatus Kariarchaeaceae archaeon]